MIVTLNEVKEYLNIDTTNSEYDNILTTLIVSASKEIERLCNQPIEVNDMVEIINGTGNQYYRFSYFPINSITSIKYRSNINQNFDDITAIDSNSYTLLKDGNLYVIYYEDSFKTGRYNYEIKFSQGYTVVPDEIKTIASEMVQVAFRKTNYKEGTLDVSQFTQNIRAIIHTTQYKNMWDEWLRRLSNFRRVNVT